MFLFSSYTHLNINIAQHGGNPNKVGALETIFVLHPTKTCSVPLGHVPLVRVEFSFNLALIGTKNFS